MTHAVSEQYSKTLDSAKELHPRNELKSYAARILALADLTPRPQPRQFMELCASAYHEVSSKPHMVDDLYSVFVPEGLRCRGLGLAALGAMSSQHSSARARSLDVEA